MPSRPDRAIRSGYFAPRDSFVNGRPPCCARLAPASGPKRCSVRVPTEKAIYGRWELMAWEMRLGETLIRPPGERPQGIL